MFLQANLLASTEKNKTQHKKARNTKFLRYPKTHTQNVTCKTHEKKPNLNQHAD